MKFAPILLLGLAISLAGLCSFSASSIVSQDEGEADLERLFAENGIRLDLEQKLCSIDASIAVREELLEYLLVASHGASHESLFVTEANASALNTAFLALGVEPGSNAIWGSKSPMPSEEELKAGASPYEITPPKGDGFYIYVTWREGDETYFYRVEDVIRNLATGRCMKRHRWVYLGSRMVQWEQADELAFAAEMLGNLINVAFFEQGDTILTGSLPACVEQSIWMGNSWLLPERGKDVKLIFARERLSSLPAGILQEESAGDR